MDKIYKNKHKTVSGNFLMLENVGAKMFHTATTYCMGSPESVPFSWHSLQLGSSSGNPREKSDCGVTGPGTTPVSRSMTRDEGLR